MFVTPSQPVRNSVVQIPGSKSYTHRVLIAAALADGKSVIRNALRSEDTQLTMNALQQMGVSIKEATSGIEINGCNGHFRPTEDPIFLGNSGTSMRLLISLAALGQGEYLLTGTRRMQERPVQALLYSLGQIGVPARSLNQNGCPPLLITGGKVNGTHVDIDCSISSQFLSSLLLMAPNTDGGLQIDVRRGPVSRPYIDMTVDIMQQFGVAVEREGYEHFMVPGRQQYCPGNYTVESDVSNASYFWAAGAITGKLIKVLGIQGDSLQGDLKILHLFEEMGCQVRFEQDGIAVAGEALKPIEADMGDMPDMVPTVAVVAAFARGTSCIKNVAHLRAKECDRLDAVIKELKSMGIVAHSSGDDLYIEGGQPLAAEIETYNDHRIAMSFAIAGLQAPGTRIRNPGCVEKSFPNFWEVYETLFK
ncbi:MAG: 3-phosphoshikimate 1-carboxyvinyltransferase [Deltaproteobacteria bacterium]|nr:3-phosphoshikimate 1-carboxyvinyltransferase [Deltaproteobacteria bacterium]